MMRHSLVPIRGNTSRPPTLHDRASLEIDLGWQEQPPRGFEIGPAWFEGRGCAIQVLAGLRAWIEAAGRAPWSSSLGTPLRIPMA
jgi:hypothetical protein